MASGNLPCEIIGGGKNGSYPNLLPFFVHFVVLPIILLPKLKNFLSLQPPCKTNFGLVVRKNWNLVPKEDQKLLYKIRENHVHQKPNPLPT